MASKRGMREMWRQMIGGERFRLAACWDSSELPLHSWPDPEMQCRVKTLTLSLFTCLRETTYVRKASSTVCTTQPL